MLDESLKGAPVRAGSDHEAALVGCTKPAAGSDHEAAVCAGALVTALVTAIGALATVIGATAIGVLGVGVKTMLGL